MQQDIQLVLEASLFAFYIGILLPGKMEVQGKSNIYSYASNTNLHICH